jgi:hypothetical protein
MVRASQWRPSRELDLFSREDDLCFGEWQHRKRQSFAPRKNSSWTGLLSVAGNDLWTQRENEATNVTSLIADVVSKGNNFWSSNNWILYFPISDLWKMKDILTKHYENLTASRRFVKDFRAAFR